MKRLAAILLLLPLLAFAAQEMPLPETSVGFYRVGEVDYLAAEPFLTELGGNVFWNAAVRRLTVNFDGRTASVSPFADFALIDGRTVPLGATPRFISGRLCLPVSFYQEAVPALTDKKFVAPHVPPAAPEEVVLRPYVDRDEKVRKMLSLRRIVLDAGHGGHDPGARSPQGHREKDVNLGVVLLLAQKLRQETDLEVVLTRGDDTFIPLPGRTEIANGSDADLFMSVHANGAYNRSATGFEVYFLSTEASDARSASLAAFENRQTVENEVPGDEMPLGDDLSMILRDMIRTENLASSEKLALAIQARLDIAMHIENRGVKQAPFFVLAGAQMPAVLVEVGFMSNAREADLLLNRTTQEIIVSALFQAIMYYDAVRAAAAP